MMTVVTINARVNTWTAEISNVVSDHPFERHFTVEGNIHRGTRFALGAELTGLMVSIRRTFQGLDSSLTETLRLKPNPVFDVAPGEQRPIGAASSAEGFSRCCCSPEKVSSMNFGIGTFTAGRCRAI
jgi:hypothetical protein